MVATNLLVFYNANSADGVLLKLWVYHTKTKQKDSSSEWLFLKVPSAGLPANIYICNTDIELKFENYNPTKYNYGWHQEGGYTILDGERVLYIISKKRKYRPFIYSDTLHRAIASIALKNCVNYDTVNIRSVKASLSKLGQQTNLLKCNEMPVTISIKPIWYAKKIQWANGDTSLYRTVLAPGKYGYSIALDSCTYFDTIYVFDYTYPSYTLDTNLCKGDKVLNKIKINSNGSYGFFTINGFNANNYLLNVSLILIKWMVYDSSCFFTDTFRAPLKSQWPYSTKNYKLCAGDKITLKAPKKPFEYIWSTGEIADSIIVDSGADYQLKARLNNCSYNLTYAVNEVLPPKKINDTTVCNFDEPLIMTINNDYKLLWSTGENSSSISINDSGYYWVMAEAENCIFHDTFQVIRDCPAQLYIPNAFTPGNDHINPIFLAKGTEIEQYEMLIYAQNGQLVFYTNDINKGWDGTVRWELAQMGTFFYIISYTQNGQSKLETGNLTLLR